MALGLETLLGFLAAGNCSGATAGVGAGNGAGGADGAACGAPKFSGAGNDPLTGVSL
jgi:hypothetical protein